MNNFGTNYINMEYSKNKPKINLLDFFTKDHL